jgi:PAS domain S-box-containing protein
MSELQRMAAVPPQAEDGEDIVGPDITADALDYALGIGAIIPHFQPIVEVSSGQLKGFEVLARWPTADGSGLLPDAFIPLAVKAGLIAELTAQIVAQACAKARAWPGTFYLAFNMPPTLLQDAATVERIIRTMEEADFPLSRVRVEMTERELLEDDGAAELGMVHLRALGIKTMLDDFGTGYSSLIRLHRFEFDKIKIDGSFIRSLEYDASSRKIVSAIVGLGQSLGAKVVAESVETLFQLQFLASIGCDTYQGWWLAPAMDARRAAAWLATYQPSEAAQSITHLSPYQRQYQLEILYERSPVGLAFIDLDLRFVAANAKLCDMIDVPRARVIGHRVLDVLPEGIRNYASELIERGLRDDQGDLSEVLMPSGETFLLNHERVVDAAGVVLGISVVCIDISDAKRYEAALQARAGA